MSERLEYGSCRCVADPETFSNFLVGTVGSAYAYEKLKDLGDNICYKIWLSPDVFQTCDADTFAQVYTVVAPTTTTRSPLKPPPGMTAEDFKKRFKRKETEDASGGD